MLVRTSWFLFFVDIIAFCISSTNFGEAVVCYWLARMGWWDNSFNNKFNILLLTILKNQTNWSAACNFESLTNAVYCYSGQIFISTWYEINFIRCCTRWGTRIGTNIERVGVKMFFLQFFFGSIYQRKFDKMSRFISGCRVLIGRVALSVFSSSWLFVGKNFLIFIFCQYNCFYISSTNVYRVVVWYWVSRMGWWIQNSNLECGL